MDRFIAIDLAIQKNGSGVLKSNMDRFIALLICLQIITLKILKSNMDRFIGVTSWARYELFDFKIQYG